MKKNTNVEILKDENSILTSYKLDLEKKKKMLISELKQINKAKEKKEKYDEEKARILILEKIHKPDFSFIKVDDEEKNKVVESKPLAEYERIYTKFSRYSPTPTIKIELEDGNVIEEVKEIKKQREFKTIDVVDDTKFEYSIPLAYKDRIYTNFKRYQPVFEYEDHNDGYVNQNILENEDNNYKVVASPYIYQENVVEDNNIEHNQVLEDIKNISNNINENQSNNNVDVVNMSSELDKEDDIYPVPYKELLKMEGINEESSPDEVSTYKVQPSDEEVLENKNNPPEILPEEEYANLSEQEKKELDEKRRIFQEVNNSFESVVEWAKYYENLKNKKS